MKSEDELKIPLSEAELERIRQAAEEKGMDVEEWAREELLRILRKRDQQS